MELISYSLDFASFLIQSLDNLESISSIILFGSVAREEADKDSDIDIFIDIVKIDKKLTKKIEGIKSKFFDSVKFKKYWKLMGVDNEINIIVDELDNWKLKDSMIGNSIILYQKYSSTISGGDKKALLSWGSIKPESRRVTLNKKLFGYKHYKKHYPGLLNKFNGSKMSTNTIMIPVEQLNLFIKEFRKLKIPVKILRITTHD
ncbi:hypothetical protein COU61_01400 [Candidatus Pacearchaeota archaeon CG10_big_fil_rev_8_21_14_0_10_35_13]|nr:MAG: hypothetical protein COU61_01400 [Candidatus Pacearchaeota archaeon CG10_big_fil_rev_8_21_14_0_10_35_13]